MAWVKLPHNSGHLSINDKLLMPTGVRHSEASMYERSICFSCQLYSIVVRKRTKPKEP